MVDALYSPCQKDKYSSEVESQRGQDVVVLGKERRARGEGFYDTLERPHSANLGTVALILQQGSQRVIHLGLLGGCSSELRENEMMSWYSGGEGDMCWYLRRQDRRPAVSIAMEQATGFIAPVSR